MSTKETSVTLSAVGQKYEWYIRDVTGCPCLINAPPAKVLPVDSRPAPLRPTYIMPARAQSFFPSIFRDFLPFPASAQPPLEEQWARDGSRHRSNVNSPLSPWLRKDEVEGDQPGRWKMTVFVFF